ncbi:MAG: hypothetical protein ACREOD_08175 [Candidatus Dormibacteria bacterium]
MAHQSGAKILEAAAQAMARAHSYQIVAQYGSGTTSKRMTFDVQAANVGRGSFSTGTFSFEAEEVGGTDYFRSRDLWAQVGGSALQTALGDRWVYIAANSTTALQLTQAFASLTSPTQLAALIRQGQARALRGPALNVGGEPAITVREPGGAVFWVATSGPPYLLGGDQPGPTLIHLNRFGARFGVHRPQHALSLQSLLAG